MPELSFAEKTIYGWRLLLAPTQTQVILNKKSNEEIGKPNRIVYRTTEILERVVGSENYEIDILARTLYGEARGETYRGMQAVANVIVNRAKQGIFGHRISGVCLKKGQFSCWNPKTGYVVTPAIKKNYDAMMAATISTPYFAQCIQIAQLAVKGKLPDITGGADHYYAKSIATPSWAKGKQLTAIDGHYFLNA